MGLSYTYLLKTFRTKICNSFNSTFWKINFKLNNSCRLSSLTEESWWIICHIWHLLLKNFHWECHKHVWQLQCIFRKEIQKFCTCRWLGVLLFCRPRRIPSRQTERVELPLVKTDGSNFSISSQNIEDDHEHIS